jgi:hypothetical protein
LTTWPNYWGASAVWKISRKFCLVTGKDWPVIKNKIVFASAGNYGVAGGKNGNPKDWPRHAAYVAKMAMFSGVGIAERHGVIVSV